MEMLPAATVPQAVSSSPSSSSLCQDQGRGQELVLGQGSASK